MNKTTSHPSKQAGSAWFETEKERLMKSESKIPIELYEFTLFKWDPHPTS